MKTTRRRVTLLNGLVASVFLACACATTRGTTSPHPAVVDSIGAPPVALGQDPAEEGVPSSEPDLLPAEQVPEPATEATPEAPVAVPGPGTDPLVPPGSSRYVSDRIRELEAWLRPLKAIPVPGGKELESGDEGS